MKVELRARPVMYFTISRADVEVLMRCAKRHYDGACQRTAMAADLTNLQPGANRYVLRRNGVLVQWKNLFGEQDTAEVDCTMDVADLLCKVTECWVQNQHGADQPTVDRWHKAFYNMVGLGNRAYGLWKLEVEL